jgi:hypothetical protein
MVGAAAFWPASVCGCLLLLLEQLEPMKAKASTNGNASQRSGEVPRQPVVRDRIHRRRYLPDATGSIDRRAIRTRLFLDRESSKATITFGITT